MTAPDNLHTQDQHPEGGDNGPPATPGPDTGDPTVDRIVGGLTDLDDQPPEAHVDAYDAVHSGLQGTLADLDRDA